jgi:hypothetical protein
MAVLGACGADEEERAQTTTTPPATTETEAATESETMPTEEAPAATAPESETAERETETGPAETAPATSPEDQPGGVGDEEPAHSLALFTGRAGKITPRVIRVPAFISIRVELRSADGRRYGLVLGGERISVGGGLASVSTTIEGLRPGRAVIGNPVGAGNRVRVEATAEPGP